LELLKTKLNKHLKNNFKDFEDSIQYSTVLTVKGIEAILTRNIKDYRNSEIAVMTPLTYLKMKERNEV